MKFFSLTAALILGVSALPAETIAESPNNFLDPVQNIPPTPPVVDGATPFVSGTVDKRDASLFKRATLTVDIWMDSDKRGRHEGLITTTNKCYGLGNGWNDEISSLSVPRGFGCIFYRNSGCNSNDNQLTVPGGNYIANLGTYSFNDKISSYLCYT